MRTAHIIGTTDAINGFDVSNLTTGPDVVEGHDANDLTIRFEN